LNSMRENFLFFILNESCYAIFNINKNLYVIKNNDTEKIFLCRETDKNRRKYLCN